MQLILEKLAAIREELKSLLNVLAYENLAVAMIAWKTNISVESEETVKVDEAVGV